MPITPAIDRCVIESAAASTESPAPSEIPMRIGFDGEYWLAQSEMVFKSAGSSAACNVVEAVVKLVRYALTSNPTTKHPCAASSCATCGPR